jgi:GT2 family glycosyltransferase
MSSPELVFAFDGGQNNFFRELAEKLIFELARLGVRGSVVLDDFPVPRSGMVTVLLPPHEYANLSKIDLSPPLLDRCILISAEQPTSGFFPWNVNLAHGAGAVFDINRRAVRAYQDSGIPAEHLQLGHSEAWERPDHTADRDIDILFLGRATGRRERALAAYADVLERFECELVLSDDRTANAAAGANFAAGEDKLRLLGRSKVLLNVHGEDEPYFEWLRAVEAICCGCVLVSESSTDLDPLRPGVDLVTGGYSSLGLLAAWMAEDDDRRREIAENGMNRLRAEAPLSRAAEKLAEAAGRVDGHPVTDRARQEAGAARAGYALARAKPPPKPPAPDPGFSPGEQRALRALKRQQLEIVSLRRQLAANALVQERLDRAPPGTVKVAETPAFRDEGRPLVSVIVPLYNHADVVTDALDSVVSSTFGSWEIVVVDDASTDGGPAAVRAWMDRHPDRGACMVRHEVNRGLSAARNTGAKTACGDLLLMLDSDNSIRSLGLARLIRVLVEDPGADFAYGIIDRFEGEEPVDLISKFGWEPVRFREGNYIDALTLIRRRALFEMQGYSADPRLALGLEDYDLWARIAEEGRRGAFVRQLVASYRAGHSSMRAVTAISTTDAIVAISEHAPTLMRGVDPPVV